MQGPIGYQLSPLAEEATRIIDGLKGAPSWVTTYYDNLNRLAQIIELQDVEIASRGKSIQTMNTILGYDNSDGKHNTPTPEDLAKAAVEDAWKYRQLVSK